MVNLLVFKQVVGAVLFFLLDNVELVLDSSAIPESGTAKVRSRPAVKHYMVSSSA
jgi:hypothetical protein